MGNKIRSENKEYKGYHIFANQTESVHKAIFASLRIVHQLSAEYVHAEIISGDISMGDIIEHGKKVINEGSFSEEASGRPPRKLSDEVYYCMAVRSLIVITSLEQSPL